MNIKRINLYFDMNREEDSKVYEEIKKQKKKTDYIISLVLKNNRLPKEEIKELVKEIIEEYNFMPNKESANGEEKSNIPDDIFNFFEQI